MELFKMFGRILIDDSEANKSISRTDKNTKSMGDRLKGGIKTAAKWGAALAAGAAVAIGGMIKLGSRVGQAADEILDLESVTRMTTDSIQEWRKVAEVAGVSQDAMGKAAERINRNMSTMESETNKGRVAMEKLGLSFEDISSMDTDERMQTLTRAMQDADESIDIATVGSDLFGSAWKEIAPIVDLGAEKMQKAKDSANIISEDDLNKANEFRIRIDNMKERLSFFVTEIGLKVLPILTVMFDWFEKQMPKIEEFGEKAFGAIEIAMEKASDFITDEVLPVLVNLWEWIEPNLPLIQETFVNAFEAIRNILGNVVELVTEHILPAFISMWEWIEPHLPEIKELFKDTFEFIEEAINKVIETVGWLAEKIEEHWNIVQPIIIAYATLIATRLIVQWVRAGVTAIASAGQQVAAWVMTQVAAAKAVAIHVATAATMVARWVFMGAQAMAQAARMAAAWLIAMGPVGWVIAGIVGLVAIVVLNWDKIVGATQWLGNKLTEIWETTVNWITGKVDALLNFFGGLKSKFASKARGMWDGVKDSFRAAMNWIIGKWNAFQLKLGGQKVSLPFGQSFNIPSINLNTPNIPMLAKGGNIKDNNSVIVGEAGPEILSGMKGARVTPLDRAGELGSVMNFAKMFEGAIFNVRSEEDIKLIAREIHNLTESKKRGLGFA